MHGYDAYDFGARHTYSALGRFTSMDPLAEKYYNTSPYVYCAGNPVKYVDPDGNEIKSMLSKKDSGGEKYYSKYDNSESLILFAHGYKNAKGVADMRCVKTQSIETASDLKNVLSDVFSNYKEDEPQTIILICCRTAEDVNGIAQDLSNEMPKSTVIAPTSSIEQETTKGAIFEGRVTVQNGGDWIILKNGKETDRYDGHWQPKSRPSKMDYLLYNKKDSFIDRLIKCIKDE